jgi:hypothetical protein
MITGRRWVGCCLFCKWQGDKCKWCITAGHQAQRHAREAHPDRFGFVGYIRVTRIRRRKQ